MGGRTLPTGAPRPRSCCSIQQPPPGGLQGQDGAPARPRRLTQGMRDEVQEGIPQKAPRGEAEQQLEQGPVLRAVGLHRNQEQDEVGSGTDEEGGPESLGGREQGGVTEGSPTPGDPGACCTSRWHSEGESSHGLAAHVAPPAPQCRSQEPIRGPLLLVLKHAGRQLLPRGRSRLYITCPARLGLGAPLWTQPGPRGSALHPLANPPAGLSFPVEGRGRWEARPLASPGPVLT